MLIADCGGPPNIVHREDDERQIKISPSVIGNFYGTVDSLAADLSFARPVGGEGSFSSEQHFLFSLLGGIAVVPNQNGEFNFARLVEIASQKALVAKPESRGQ